MRTKIRFFALFFFISTVLALPGHSAQVSGRKCYPHGCFYDFSGPAFSVAYPIEFYVNEMPGDSEYAATFVSPDNAVEFYMFFSLASGGSDSYIEHNPITEKIVSTKTVADKSGTITWITIAAKNQSYTRSYQIHKNSGVMYKAVGIRYRNQAVYNAYKSKYLHFKKSGLACIGHGCEHGF